MKKIIIILFSFMFILFGCTSASTYSIDDLTNSGYVQDANGNYEYVVDENGSVFVALDSESGNKLAIAAEIYPTSYQTLQLKYLFDTGEWSAIYNQSTNGLNPNDVYAYMSKVAPDVVSELTRLAEDGNVDMSTLEGGDKVVIEKLLNDVLIISNVTVEDVTSTVGALENSVYYLQVNFDVTNNSGDVIILDGWKKEVCYTTPVGEDCAVLTPLTEGEKTKDLDQNTTMTLKMKADAPIDAYDFYVSIGSEAKGIFIQSEVVNK